MPMKKLFNVRYPLIVFLVVALAVLSVVCVVYHKLVWAVFAFFILSAFVTWCFVKGQKAVAVVLIVSYLLGLGVMALEVAQIKGRAVSFDGKCVVSGYVCDANLDGSVLFWCWMTLWLQATATKQAARQNQDLCVRQQLCSQAGHKGKRCCQGGKSVRI